MSFYLFFFCGIAGGLLGGMGMGGGTALIPLLTILLGVEQSVAQGVNLLSFFPMSLIALSVHAQNGLLEKRGLAYLIVPALLLSAAGALLAGILPSSALRRGFGVFLVILSVFQLAEIFRKPQNPAKNSKIR